jgi:hypothetical protein
LNIIGPILGALFSFIMSAIPASLNNVFAGWVGGVETALVQPGGSIRDREVIEAANRLDMAMVFTGVRHFRH